MKKVPLEEKLKGLKNQQEMIKQMQEKINQYGEQLKTALNPKKETKKPK